MKARTLLSSIFGKTEFAYEFKRKLQRIIEKRNLAEEKVKEAKHGRPGCAAREQLHPNEYKLKWI